MARTQLPASFLQALDDAAHHAFAHRRGTVVLLGVLRALSGPGAESVFCPCGEQISERKVHLALTFGNRGCHPLFQQSVKKSFILAGQIRQTRQMFDDSRLKLLLQQRE